MTWRHTSHLLFGLLASLAACPGLSPGASTVSIEDKPTANGTFQNSNPKNFRASAATAVAGSGDIMGFLNSGVAVTISSDSAFTSTGDLTLVSGLMKVSGATTTLTLEAKRDLLLNGFVFSSGNPIPLVLTADRNMSSSGVMNSSGGTLTLNATGFITLGAGMTAGAGQIQIQSGLLQSVSPQFLNGSTVTLAAGAGMRFWGTIGGNLTVAGNISPGAPGKTKSIQVQGALTLQSTATTRIELDGTAAAGISYDQITATGAISVAGALDLAVADTYQDQLNNAATFTILQGASRTGTFSGLNSGARVSLANGLGTFRITYTSTSVILDDWQPVFTDLTWDPGSSESGTQVYSNTGVGNDHSGAHYFRITTQTTDIGAWRTRLTVSSGTASLYLSKGVLPSISSFQYSATDPAARAITLRDGQFLGGETWYIMVYASQGALWSLVSGRAHVNDLGTLTFSDTNGNNRFDFGETPNLHIFAATAMPAEGRRFFKLTAPPGTPAFSLYLNGSSRSVAVRSGLVPFHDFPAFHAVKQSGKMLVTPPVLNTEGGTYYLSIEAPPGESVGMNAQIVSVNTLAYGASTSNLAVSGNPYRIYRVQVPSGQMAWDISTTAVAGNPNVAVSKNTVASEWQNDAYSEAPGTATDSITLVPGKLTGGDWFITLYSAGNYTFNLANGDPTLTALAFTDTKTNDQPARAGGRFYALTNVASQIGRLGWELQLSAAVAGTQIAVRRNQVPGRWQYRTFGIQDPVDTQTQYVDDASTTGLLQRQNHEADIWYVGVILPHQQLTSFSLASRELTPATLAFNNSPASVTGHAPRTWKYYKVTVGPGPVGWDLIVSNVTAGNPQMVVSRGTLPESVSNSPWANPSSHAAWPAGGQWAAEVDWTGRPYQPGGAVSLARRRLVMAMGAPLEPGDYIVGIYNEHPTEAAAYTLVSRGIGAGQFFPLTSLQPVLDSATITNLAPRDAAYFKISIPTGMPGWEFTLTPSTGEMMMCVRRGAVPDFRAFENHADLQRPDIFQQVRVQKTGPERYMLLPPDGQNSLRDGDYYIAVVSEGVSPANSLETGTGPASGVLSIQNPPFITNLGTITTTANSQFISLAAGQVRCFRFNVTAANAQLEVRLDNRVGNPGVSLVTGTNTASPRPGFEGDYGWSGGQETGLVSRYSDDLITVAGAPTGDYRLTLRAGAVAGAYPAASATLVVRLTTPVVINPDPVLIGNGFTSTDSRQLQDGQKIQYNVTVPATAAGQPVLGWLLKTSHTQGATSMRIYKGGEDPATGILAAGSSALLVPPFLTLGDTWVVELEGQGLTDYTLSSQLITTLQAAAWTMPAASGLGFGDTGLDANGNPKPGDQGTSINTDEWHFYAVDVPAGNAGLLRTELRALGGNPDLYIREDGVPTPDHDSNGGLGGGSPLVHRRLVDPNTEYGNWVPADGRLENQLRPGRWHLAVRAAGGAPARYRLLVSTGTVTALNLSSGAVASQTLAARDWRYYQFTVPATAPETWNLTFAQTTGDVVMWLRDTVPPGNYQLGSEINDQGPGIGLRSWYGDAKNQGPYNSSGHDAPGTHAFQTPPLRPGHTYYAGFHAKTDATFSFSSTVSGVNIPAPPALDYSTGAIQASVPAQSSLLYQIQAPADATRLIFKATHSNLIQLRLEQGTLPGTLDQQHWTSGSNSNATFNQELSATAWPWQPGRTYYLRILNIGFIPADVSLTMDGRSPANADEDLDGLPDTWEKLYYAGIHDATITTDTDEDGLGNLVEYAFNLSPLVSGAPTLVPGTGLSGLPSITTTGSGATLRLRVEFIRRRNPHLKYEVQFLSEFGGAGWQPTTNGPVVFPIDAQWERVVIDDTETSSTASQRFGRVVVTVIP